MRRALAVAGLVLTVGALATAAGCGRLTGRVTGVEHPNQPPNTVLFVDGDVDIVNHIVHLYWFGTDPDGEVRGFEWRLLNPASPADTNWRFTTLTDSVFTVQAPGGYTDTRFTVRAVDDAGLRDPDPPVQRLEFSNKAPIVTNLVGPASKDTVFASVSVTWRGFDADGDASKLTYHVWLDGNEATPEVTTERSFTMPTDRFGPLVTGSRTLYVRAIDDGGRAGPAASLPFNVRQPFTGPRGRLLIVDEAPASTANTRFDTLYSNSVARVGLTTGDYAILRLEPNRNQPFLTPRDVQQTFELFDVVVWYRGQEITYSTVLETAEAGIAAYLDGGGRFYLDGLYLIGGVGGTGPLSEDFVRSHLGSRGMRSDNVTTPVYTGPGIGYGNTGTSVFLPHVDVHGTIARDSMYVRTVFQVRGSSFADPWQTGGLRHFDFLDRDQVVLWGAPGTLTPADGDSTAVGISVPQPNGGRAVVVCMPPGGAQPPVGAGGGSAARFVTNIYRHLGLDQ